MTLTLCESWILISLLGAKVLIDVRRLAIAEEDNERERALWREVNPAAAPADDEDEDDLLNDPDAWKRR